MQTLRNLTAAAILGLVLWATAWAMLSLAPAGPERTGPTEAGRADTRQPTTGATAESGRKTTGASTEAECRQERRPRLSRDACTALIETGEYEDDPLAAIHFNRANAHRRLGDLEAAIADYDTAIRLVPTSWAYFANRAATRKMMGQTQAALDDIEHALRLDPGNPRIQYNFAAMLASTGRNEQALAQLNAALSGRPAYPLALLLRGTVQRRLGAEDAARRDWQDAFRQGGNGFAVRVQRLLERRGHYKPAAGIYEATLTPEIERALIACADDVECL